jgi:hypothetical protein
MRDIPRRVEAAVTKVLKRYDHKRNNPSTWKAVRRALVLALRGRGFPVGSVRCDQHSNPRPGTSRLTVFVAIDAPLRGQPRAFAFASGVLPIEIGRSLV